MAKAARSRAAEPAEARHRLGLAERRGASAPWSDRVLRTSHGRIALRETAGDGLPLVLLHGNSSSKEAFEAQMGGAVGARHRLVAVDLPGHGGSDDAAEPARSYTLLGYADLVAEVVEELGLGRFALLGWSLGGHVALEVCASVPGVAGVMTVGTPPIGTDAPGALRMFRPGAFLRLGAQAALSEAEVAAFAATTGVAGRDDLVAAIRRADGRARAEVMADALAGGASDERAIVAAMRVPLAVIDGAEDAVVDPHYADGLAYGRLWEGRRHVIPRAGHAPFLSAPDLFNAILARFLRDLGAAPAPEPPLGLCFGG